MTMVDFDFCMYCTIEIVEPIARLKREASSIFAYVARLKLVTYCTFLKSMKKPAEAG